MLPKNIGMANLVAGASGATGMHLVEQLLLKGEDVKVIVRNASNIPPGWKDNPGVTIIEASILDIPDERLRRYVQDCTAIASCLGHNLSFKGIYGKPRRLVRDAVIKLTNAVRQNEPDQPVRFVLMNTTGNRNKERSEPRSVGERIVIALLRVLLPPQPDNEQAARYLQYQIGKADKFVQWVAVRPDSLIDKDDLSAYEVHPSPLRSPIFNSGKTSRINVGHFMAALATDDSLWKQWQSEMPVIYNKED